MGRTLHYRLIKSTGFTKRELKAIEEVNAIAARPSISKSYVCEWFNVPTVPLYSYKRDLSTHMINKAYKKRLEAHNGDTYEATVEMIRDGYYEPFYSERDQMTHILNGKFYQPTELRGFTKVRSSEHNAVLVYLFLLQISKEIPDAIIHLSDERDGHCALRITRMIIRNSQTILDREATNERLNYLQTAIALSSPIGRKINTTGISSVSKHCSSADTCARRSAARRPRCVAITRSRWPWQ